MKREIRTTITALFMCLMIQLILSSYVLSQVTDIDDNAYKTVTIGKQEWMSENLNVSKFRNGEAIPEAKTVKEWDKAMKEQKAMWCYYENNSDNGRIYGKIYNWYAVNDPRGLAPEGWRIPNDDDWKKLSKNLGGENEAGKKMKSESGWNEGGNGNNISGFTGLPGGSCAPFGKCHDIGKIGHWWSSTEFSEEEAGSFFVSYENSSLEYWFSTNKRAGLSVRCIKE